MHRRPAFRGLWPLAVRLALGLLLAGWACAPASGPSDDAGSTELTRLASVGKAQLENKEGAAAVATYRRATEIAAGSAAAWRNLARAQLLVREEGRALAALERAGRLQPGSPATEYLSGVALAREGRFEDAIPHLERAVELDPETAPLRFQLANALQATERHERAIVQLEETVRLDPLHATAFFKLSRYAAAAGERRDYERWNREFLRLRRALGEEARSAEELETCRYTRAELAPPGEAGAAGAEPAAFEVRFSPAPELLGTGHPDPQRIAAAALLDLDAEGRYTLATIDRGDGPAAIRALTWGGEAFEPIALDIAWSAPAPTAPVRLLAADYFDPPPAGESYDPALHARADLLVLSAGSGPRLLLATGDGSFREVTGEAGLADARASAALWVDAEHDGDLDLLLGGDGLTLYRNDGDGRFSDGTAAAGLGAVAWPAAAGASAGTTAGPVRSLAAADLALDVAVDLAATAAPSTSKPATSGGEPPPTLLLEGLREGTFAPRPEPPGPWPPARLVLLDDLVGAGTATTPGPAADGYPDGVLLKDGEIEIVAGGGEAGRWSTAAPGLRPLAAALLDADNDGRVDLAVLSEAERGSAAVRLFRNLGGGRLAEVSAEAGLQGLKLPLPAAEAGGALAADSLAADPLAADLLAADLDSDGDTDLLALTGAGAPLLLRSAGAAGGQLKLRLVGTKTNPGGIGTQVEARRGGFRTARTVTGPAVELGVGEHRQLDAVRTLWTNGVVDNEIEIELPAGPLTLVEKNVATGSCPFLYAWDGERHRFVTDLLGNSPVGLPLARGVPLPADPDELVEIGPGAALAPRDGAYRLVVTSEFREVLYLDQAELVAVDHPPGVEVHPTDRLGPEPFPPSELWALGERRPLRRAVGFEVAGRVADLAAESANSVAGPVTEELTEQLAQRDGRFASPGRLRPPPLRGAVFPRTVELDFGPLPADRPLVLALTGWLQYGDASTNIALSQAAGSRPVAGPAGGDSLEIVPPRLEVESGGVWLELPVVVGAPAGKTKTILVDLAGRLPPDAGRLRLVTTFEIRWDRIALFERLPDELLGVHRLAPSAAELAWRGFSPLIARASGHPTTPEFEVVAERPPWRTALAGWSTRYGDVLELVARREGMLAVVNSGDAVHLAFPAATPPPPADPERTRSWFFYSVGWDKDGDHNVAGGDRVGPMPVAGPPAGGEGGDWEVHYNTRWVPWDRFATEPER